MAEQFLAKVPPDMTQSIEHKEFWDYLLSVVVDMQRRATELDESITDLQQRIEGLEQS